MPRHFDPDQDLEEEICDDEGHIKQHLSTAAKIVRTIDWANNMRRAQYDRSYLCPVFVRLLGYYRGYCRDSTRAANKPEWRE